MTKQTAILRTFGFDAEAKDAIVISENVATITMVPNDQEAFGKDSDNFKEQQDIRNQWLHSALSGLGNQAKLMFDDVANESLSEVNSSFAYGSQIINNTVFRSYTLDNGDVLENHTVLLVNEDYTDLVSDALDGIFTDDLHDDAE